MTDYLNLTPAEQRRLVREMAEEIIMFMDMFDGKQPAKRDKPGQLVCPACGGSGGEYPTCTICGTEKVPALEAPEDD